MMHEQMNKILRAIEMNRFQLSDEKQTQVEISYVFHNSRIEFVREARLSDRDIPDFLVSGGIAVEVKIKGQRKAIYRQLERYAALDRVLGIVLVTSVSMHLPAEIGGKPTRVASLSKGWL